MEYWKNIKSTEVLPWLNGYCMLSMICTTHCCNNLITLTNCDIALHFEGYIMYCKITETPNTETKYPTITIILNKFKDILKDLSNL